MDPLKNPYAPGAGVRPPQLAGRDGDLDAFVALPNREEGEMGPRLATALVLNPDYVYEREIIYPGPLVTAEMVEGQTDRLIEEFAAYRFPLRGVTDKGY